MTKSDIEKGFLNYFNFDIRNNKWVDMETTHTIGDNGVCECLNCTAHHYAKLYESGEFNE